MSLALGCAILASPAARAGEVAITFDDLPGLTIAQDQRYEVDFNDRLLRSLVRGGVPATAFVIGRELEEGMPLRRRAIVRRWRAAGMVLGNHTYSHETPETLGTSAYIADVASGEAVLRQLVPARAARWFRPPELATGATPARKRAIQSWLWRHGERLAPVTIEASDWLFAEPYDDALLKGDLVRARRIRTQYLAYTAQRVAWSRRAARALFGRDIAHVMLLHDTRLNADSMGRILRLLRRQGLRPVTLGRALGDPAYRTADRYVSAEGDGWLERWSATLRRPLPDGDEDPPTDIQAQYDQVDNDRH